MRVARRVLSLGKGTAFTGREIVASSQDTPSLGYNSFSALLQMLNAQSFILGSSPSLTLLIKVHIDVHLKHSVSWIFDSIHTASLRGNFPLRQVVLILGNFAKYCESLSF